MRGFLDRYLPVSERRTALWLALGGAAVAWVAAGVRQQVILDVTGELAGPSAVQTSMVLVVVAAQFAAVALLVAALIRFARAPKALALYLPLQALATAVASAGTPPSQTADQAGVALGALAGAWIASTVSLARIRDTGFSGDEPNGAGLSTERPRAGWAFLGWEGRPLQGDALLAVVFAAVGIVPQVAFALVGLLGSPLAIAPGEPEAAAVAFNVALSVAGAIAWLFAAYVATRRTGVRSPWLLPLSAMLSVVALVASTVLMAGGSSGWSAVGRIVGTILLVLGPSVLAALAGTELALRRRAATLADTPDSLDPGAPPAPADTAGGTDG